MYDTNQSDNGPNGFGNRAAMSKKDLLKVIAFLTDLAEDNQQSTETDFNYYDETDPFERQLDFIVEEAKRQDQIYFNTGVEAYEYENALEFYVFSKKDKVVIKAYKDLCKRQERNLTVKESNLSYRDE